MLNDDLIAFLQPAPTRWAPDEWRDVCDTLTDIRVEGARFTLRVRLPKGLYYGKIVTKPGSFDMRTAMIPMVQVPDGQRVLVGPWDLNHIDNEMAMPMAKTWVNGRLLGGLWFSVPGPEQTAEGWLSAQFGFEVETDGETVVELEFVENARERIHWVDVQSMEIRRDNRTPRELLPVSAQHPRIHVQADELAALRQRLPAHPLYPAAVTKFLAADAVLEAPTNLASQFDLACFLAWVTGDPVLTAKVKTAVLELCRLPTWSGRPDPLLMGGDNDRQCGFKLLFSGMAWEFLRDTFTAEEQAIILAKVEEYLQKLYDFTILQRGYMGHPTTEPHSLGTWFGVGMAAMAFYDELPIARKALPFFHGLFVDSLTLFPPGGKMIWATFFPYFMIRYLAMAHTFGGMRPEFADSRFLDNLGTAILACYETPNVQEMQRGQRTIEHRQLTAFLTHFHPTDGIDSIYRAFYQSELELSGNVEPTLFDMLYAPRLEGEVAEFPQRPLYVRDTSDIISIARGTHKMAVSFGAGLRFGTRASFGMVPHNRCAALPLGDITIRVDDSPVLFNIDVSYGLNNARHNAMSFNDGGIIYQGQYLLGEIEPEQSPSIRRCLIGDRFIYAHTLIAEALQPQLGIRAAERIFVMDYQRGIVLLYDLFTGTQPLCFSTHLHCSGSVTELDPLHSYRLTGGQALTISAPLRSAATAQSGLTDDEKGEVFVSILHADTPYHVTVEEPKWCPPYIYGLNNTGKERFEDARFPRYTRWRLEADGQVDAGAFLFAISSDPDVVSRRTDGGIALPNGGIIYLGNQAEITALGCTCLAEGVLVDESTQTLQLIGLRRLTLGARTLIAAIPVDIELNLAGALPQGTVFSPAEQSFTTMNGFQLEDCTYHAYHPRSRGNWVTTLKGM